jgi:hypothetical protein
MALNYADLFDRIGRAIYAANLVNEFRGGPLNSGAIATDLPTEWEDFVEQYDGEAAPLRAALGNPTEELQRAKDGLNNFQTWVQQALSATLLVTVDTESPLERRDLKTAMTELIRLMGVDAKTVDANAITVTATAGVGNVGSGAMVVSKLDGAGRTLEYCYDETIDVSFTGTTTALFAGEAAAVYGALNHDWPKGSAASKQVATITAGGDGDLLSGSGAFETFTVADTPDDWTITVGVAGTDVLEETTDVFVGDSGLALAGDGATLTQLRRDLSAVGLLAKRPYALCGWLLTDTTPAAGVLTIDLYDGVGVIDDDAGNANTLVIDLTTVSDTDFEAHHAMFRLPEPVPASVFLRLRLSTALTNTRILYLDHFALGLADQLYTGGPYCAVFTGDVAFSLDDVFSLAVTNDYGGALQTAFWRNFDMPGMGLVLPSHASGGENILDSVIA